MDAICQRSHLVCCRHFRDINSIELDHLKQMGTPALGTDNYSDPPDYNLHCDLLIWEFNGLRNMSLQSEFENFHIYHEHPFSLFLFLEC